MLDPKAEVDFNLSHDGQRVVLAGLVGPGRVGIDVLRDRLPDWAHGDVRELRETLWDHLSSRERDRLPSDDADEAALRTHLLRLWALKEAVAKAIGDGVASDLARLDFDLASRPAVATVGGEADRFRIVELGDDDYLIAIACDRECAPCHP